jgi:hypothetical protein
MGIIFCQLNFLKGIYVRIQASEETIQKKSNILFIPSPDFYLLSFHTSLCLKGMRVNL